MNGSIREQKNILRAELMHLRSEIADGERAAAERSVFQRIISLVSFRYAENILLYYPIKNEVDIISIAEYALKSGKGVAFPKCDSGSCTMTFHYINSIDELALGTYGIREPKSNAPLYDCQSSERDVILVPAVGFDRMGYRIGYGKGYYDRYLNGFKGTSIGICFDKLLKHELPRGRYDKQVDIVLTEKGIYRSK